MKKLLLLSFYLFAFSWEGAAMDYMAWTPWEPDSAATAWLLRRYVDSDAEFISLKRGTDISPPARGIDTPDALYRRGATYTAFDSAVKTHGIENPCQGRLAPIIRTLELMPWRKVADPLAEEFEQQFVPLLPTHPGPGGLKRAFAWLDQFCKKEE